MNVYMYSTLVFAYLDLRGERSRGLVSTVLRGEIFVGVDVSVGVVVTLRGIAEPVLEGGVA